MGNEVGPGPAGSLPLDDGMILILIIWSLFLFLGRCHFWGACWLNLGLLVCWVLSQNQIPFCSLLRANIPKIEILEDSPIHQKRVAWNPWDMEDPLVTSIATHAVFTMGKKCHALLPGSERGVPGTQEPVDLTEDDPGEGAPEWVIRLMVQKSGEKTTWDVYKPCK